MYIVRILYCSPSPCPRTYITCPSIDKLTKPNAAYRNTLDWLQYWLIVCLFVCSYYPSLSVSLAISHCLSIAPSVCQFLQLRVSNLNFFVNWFSNFCLGKFPRHPSLSSSACYFSAFQLFCLCLRIILRLNIKYSTRTLIYIRFSIQLDSI